VGNVPKSLLEADAKTEAQQHLPAEQQYACFIQNIFNGII
jgi:hypothetical protein